MKKTVFINLFILFISITSFSQNSRKGYEYSGTKIRYSMLGKSRMFSEGIKPIKYSLFWNKKKNTFTVNAGPKEKWYVIELTGLDTIQGNLTHIGILEGTEKETDPEKRAKSTCEVRILLDKISIKIGESRLEEYLIDGASVWNDQSIGNSK
jgi:hypothetical protein